MMVQILRSGKYLSGMIDSSRPKWAIIYMPDSHAWCWIFKDGKSYDEKYCRIIEADHE